MSLAKSCFATHLRLVLAQNLSKFFISMILQIVALCTSHESTRDKLHFAGSIFTYWGYTEGNFAYQALYFSVFQGTNLMQPLHRRLHWTSTLSYLFSAATATASAGYHDLGVHYFVIDLGNPVDVYFFIVLCATAGLGTVSLTYSLAHMYKTLARQRAEVLSNPALSAGALGRTLPVVNAAGSTGGLRNPSPANPDDPENGKPDKTCKTDKINFTVKLWILTSNVNAVFGCAAVLVCHPAVLFAANVSAACYYILIRRSLLSIVSDRSQSSGAKGPASATAQRSSTKAAAVARNGQ